MFANTQHTIAASFLLAWLLVLHTTGTAETHHYIPKPEELKYVFATVPAVLRLKPGAGASSSSALKGSITGFIVS